jgi:hypothetical protein
MTVKLLDLTKPLQTSDGRPVRHVAYLQGNHRNPYVFVVTQLDANTEFVIYRDEYGLYSGNHTTTPSIINTPPPKHVRYLNVYRSDIAKLGLILCSHDDKASADKDATPSRMA